MIQFEVRMRGENHISFRMHAEDVRAQRVYDMLTTGPTTGSMIVLRNVFTIQGSNPGTLGIRFFDMLAWRTHDIPQG